MFSFLFYFRSHVPHIASTDKKKQAEDSLNTRGDFIDSNEIGDGSPDAITENKLKQLSSETSGSRSMAIACPALLSSVIVLAILKRLVQL